MERYKGMVDECAADGEWVLYADAQATVEALQADNRTYINERHENMKQLEELRQQVEALQREVNTLNQLLRDKGLGQGEIDGMAADVDQLSHLQALVRAYQQAVVDIRDAVLNGRGPLAEMEVDNDVINAVLDIIDDNTPTTLDATPTAGMKG